MKTIEERAKECSEGYDDDGYSAGLYMGYVEGAFDQKAIDEEVRLKKCADMTPKECEREMAFVDWYYKNGKGTPTFSDAIEWARKETIDKACKCFCKTCRGQCKDNSHCDVFQVFRNELNAMEG